MKSTFSVYFYLKKGDLLTGGYAPIMGRITIDGVSKQFATQLKVISEHWNQKFQQVERTYGSSAKSKEINDRLGFIKAKIEEIYDKMRKHDLYVTAEKVKNVFCGHTILEHTLMKQWEKHLENLRKAEGVTISHASVQKYQRNCSGYPQK